MFWNFFDENGVTGYTDVLGNTRYSDNRSSYDDCIGLTHYSDGSVACDNFVGGKDYDADGNYEKSSYTDIFGVTRYY